MLKSSLQIVHAVISCFCSYSLNHYCQQQLFGSSFLQKSNNAYIHIKYFLWLRGHDDEKEYFVKWKELSYDECSWESESDISAFQPEIERFSKFQSRSRRSASSKQKKSGKDGAEEKKQLKEFQHYEQSPSFLSSGILLSLIFSFGNRMLQIQIT